MKPPSGSGVAAIILAAGRSSRMAPRNKLLEPVGGKPIVAKVADIALASGAGPIIVVTGFEAPRIAAVLSGRKLTMVHNASFQDGLSSSLRVGLSALPPDSDGTLILLGDMPGIEDAVLGALMAAFTGSDAICVPVHRARRGNPVLFGRRYFAEMMRISGDEGAKQLLARHKERVIEVEVGTDSIFVDIDTPVDLARVTAGATAARSR